MDLSLIIPAYNEEKLIAKTLASVMMSKKYFERKTGKSMEVILVDNNSYDNTVKIAEKYDIKIVSENQHNIAVVRNTGAKNASGRVLCFLDADSEVSQNIFYLIHKYMSSGKYIGGGVKFKLDRRNLTFILIFIASVFTTHITRLSGVLIYTSNEFYRQLGGFRENYYAAEDIDFILRMSKLAKQKGKKYKNIYNGVVVTSSRKFKSLSFTDIFMQGGLLLHKQLRENPEKCRQWYDSDIHR